LAREQRDVERGVARHPEPIGDRKDRESQQHADIRDDERDRPGELRSMQMAAPGWWAVPVEPDASGSGNLLHAHAWPPVDQFAGIIGFSRQRCSSPPRIPRRGGVGVCGACTQAPEPTEGSWATTRVPPMTPPAPDWREGGHLPKLSLGEERI